MNEVIKEALTKKEKQALLKKLLKEKGAAGIKAIPRQKTINNKPLDKAITKQPVPDNIPLSFSQKRLWAVDQIDDGSLPYIMSTTLVLNGQLDIVHLKAALNDILDKNEVLRTQYKTDNSGIPYQHIVNDATLNFEHVVCSDLNQHIDEYIADCRAQELSKPFDLEQDILFRATLIEIKSDCYFLMLTTHHIAADGWSIGIINEQLSAFYTQRIHQESTDINSNESDLQYKDFSMWQSQNEAAIINLQLAHWHEKLQGAPSLCTFPTDKERPEVSSYQGANFNQLLSNHHHQMIIELSQKYRVSKFMVLHSLLTCLLQRFTGEDDIVIGIPVANREQQEVKNMVGFFVNSLPLRLKLSENDNFADVLTKSRNCLLQTFAHQQLPFERLVDELKVDRTTNTSPIFQVVLAYNNNEDQGIKLPGVEVEQLSTKTITSKFDITLNVEDVIKNGEKTLEICWEYATDIYADETIERIAHYFSKLIETVAQQSELTLVSLPLLLDSDKKALLNWNQTHTDYPQQDLWSLFKEQVSQHPNKTAVWQKENNSALTYNALQQKAEKLANTISSRIDVEKPENVVAILSERCADAVVAMLALSKLGIAYLPLDIKYPKDRIKSILSDAQCSLVLIENQSLSSALPSAYSDQFIALDDSANYVAESDDDVSNTFKPEQLAYIMYTSGSTGKPKGVMVEQKSIVSLVKNIDYAPITSSDHILLTGSPVFDATTYEVWGSLLNGATLSIVDKNVLLDTEALSEVIQSRGITTMWLTSPLFNQHVQSKPDMFTCLKQLLVGGDALSVEHIELARKHNPGLCIVNGYGPTESTTFCVCNRLDPSVDLKGAKSIAIGKPINNSSAYVVNNRGMLLPVGVAGELWVGGDGVSRGYLNQVELTQEKFIDNPHSSLIPIFAHKKEKLYKTGDLVRWTKDGLIEFLGRQDDQVKIRGFRIELAEIDTVLTRHPLVKQARVLAQQNGPNNKKLIAYIALGSSVKENDSPEFKQALAEHVSSQLPDYMVPSFFVLMEQLPLNKNGKVDRKLLPQPDLSVSNTETLIHPETETEALLLSIWQTLLGVNTISVTDNFFAIGGDSILAIQVVTRAREQGLNLAVKKIFEAKTIRNLAQSVEAAPTFINAEQSEGQQQLLPIQKLFFDTAGAKLNHFNQHIMLHLDKEVSIDTLNEVLMWLIEKHDVMRLHFNKLANDQWQAHYHPQSQSDASKIIQEVDISDLTDEEFNQRCQVIANEAQASLNIETGETFRWVVIRTSHDMHLLWVMHHLIVDGVSWRILMRDFERCLNANDQDKPLIAKTDSFLSWATHLQQVVESNGFVDEKRYWHEQSQTEGTPLSFIDNEVIDLQEKHTASKEFILSKEQTMALLTECNEAYHTKISDLLLNALVCSLDTVNGRNEQTAQKYRIDLEGHGREPFSQNIDISETVGWFTSMFPVYLKSEQHNLPEMIKYNKEHIANIPNNGIGYGMLQYLTDEPFKLNQEKTSQVVFNYLGQLDHQSERNNGTLRFSLENCGNPIGETINRSHPLRISCMIKEGHLRFICDYNVLQIDTSTIEKLVTLYQYNIEKIIGHCQKAAVEYTPSDFPLIDITQKELDKLSEKYPNIETIYPTTSMQQSLLFQSMTGDNQEAVYVTQLVFSFDQADGDLMHKTWQTITDRHAIFRTVFLDIDSDQPKQLVLDKVNIDWREINLEGDPAHSKNVLKKISKAERNSGFNFNEQNAQKFAWLNDSSGQSHLIWTHHHALLDGWCLSILLDELLEIYAKLHKSDELPLADAFQYQDYIAWLNNLDKTEAESYWKNHLQGMSSATRLGLEQGTGVKNTIQLAEEIQLDSELTTALTQLSKDNEITLNSVFQGAWSILLSKYSGEKNVLFGTTVSGRPAELTGSGKMVGLFINTLPVRHEYSNIEQSVSSWLKGIHESTVKTNEYAYLSLGEIHQLSDIPGNRELFESVVVFENYPLDLELLNSQREGQPQFSNIEGIECSDLPLNLVIYPGETVRIKLAFKSDVYSQDSIKSVLQHLKNILVCLCKSHVKKLSDISILSVQEKERAIYEWNNTALNYEKNMSLYDAFHLRVLKHGKQAAIVFDKAKINYEDLNIRVNAIAQRLINQGVCHGNRVIVSLPKGSDVIASILAVMKLGAVYVPVALDCPKDRLQFIIDDADIRYAIIHSQHENNLQNATIKPIFIDQIPQHNTGLDEATAEVKGSDEAYVIYTSGTTGQPKGVSIAHHSLINLCESFIHDGLLEAGKASLQFAPYTFDASMAEIFVGLLSSTTIHMVTDEVINDLKAMQAYLNNNDVRFAAFPPQYLQHFDPESTSKNLTVLTAGTAPTLGLIQAWGKEHRYINAYGPTETTVLSSAWEYNATDIAQGNMPIGKPLANTKIYVLDHFGQLCAPQQKGEICIGGDGVALGYLNNEGLNSKHFIDDPFIKQEDDNSGKLYRTGDLGRWLYDGNIEFIGRCDHQVKIRGFRIEPDEIERCCLKDNQVEQCVVLPKPDQFGDLMLVAYVQTQINQDVIVERLKKQIKNSLPPYMKPSHFVVMSEFPMTNNGKADRKALSQVEIEQVSHELDLDADVTDQEEQLLQIWRQHLANESLQVNDDFFEFGGNSILLLRMMKPMQLAGFDISVNDFYQRRTVRKCCELFAHSSGSVLEMWKDRNIQFDIITYMEGGERTDFWLVQHGENYTLQEIQQYFASMDGPSLPDYICFVDDLQKERHLFSTNGKQALSGWRVPYERSLRKQLNKELSKFQQQYSSSPSSDSVAFTPMQESMIEWEERTVFELISVHGWYTSDALKDAYFQLAQTHELMRSLNYKNRRWNIISPENFNVDIPYLDIRFMDGYAQNKLILSLATDLKNWQKSSNLPYVACWVSISDTKHYFMMLNDHLISDESSSLAIKARLNQILHDKPQLSGRSFSSYARHLQSGITKQNAQYVKDEFAISKVAEAKKITENMLLKRQKLPVQRALLRIPLDSKKSALEQSFIIFRKFASYILAVNEFCMVMNHFGRQLEGKNDFHQVGLFLDKIPFVVNERSNLEEMNVKVNELAEKGINFIGLAEHGLLNEHQCMPALSNEVLFNYQGDQQKDPMVQQWFSRLNLRKALKKFNGIVFEARQLGRELSIHCIFRGKKTEPEALLRLIDGARFADRMLDVKFYNLTYWQRIKSVARDSLYKQLKNRDMNMINDIEVRNVRKSFGDFEAVKGVSFTVEKGKCFGILGPNGAGKTTLLGMIEGIEKMDSGSIKVLGMDINKELKKIQPHIGVQLQQNNYFQFLTVEEMLVFYRDFRSAASGQNKGMSIDELLDSLSLTDKRKALVEELSGGQQQRLTIAIAMLDDPSIVFLDEPTSALDPQTRRYTWDFIEQLKESGDKTIIITTHYMEEAERLCDELVIMNEGQIIAQGSPDKLISDLNAHYDISVLIGKGNVNDNTINSLTGVTNIQWGVDRKELTISTTRSATTLKELLDYSEGNNIELLQFHIERPSLEDVFISSTGAELRE